MSDDLTKAMYGCEAVEVPIQMVVQDHGISDGEQIVVFVGACKFGKNNHMMFGSLKPHVRVHGSLILRPTCTVVETNQLVGNGVSGILKSAFFAGHDFPDDKVIIRGGIKV